MSTAEYSGPSAEEIFGDGDGPEATVAAVVDTADGIAAILEDEQDIADAVRKRLLPILHRLPVTDQDVAVRAVAKKLPQVDRPRAPRGDRRAEAHGA